jgi:branched-chain amino acid transport system substrate-binding protein
MAAAAAALAIAGVTACGSSSSGSSAGADSSATTVAQGGSQAPAPTGSPFTIGVICACSGGINTPDPATVYKVWGDAVNAAGGINGHPVQITVKDDTDNPATSLTDAQGFISDHVTAIVDATSVDFSWEKAVAAAKIPVVGTTTSTEAFYTNPDWYAEGQTEDDLFNGIVGAARKVGGTKLALFYCAEAVQCQQGIAPLKATAKAQGLALPYAGSVAATAPNYTAQCLAAKQAGVDTVFIADSVNVIEKVVNDCTAQGYKPNFVVDAGMFSQLTSKPGFNQVTTIFSVPNLPWTADTPANNAMMAALAKYAPDETKSNGFGEAAAESWVSGKLLEAAAQAGKVGANGAAPTAAALTAGLTALKGETLGGLAAPLTFAAGKAHPVHCWFYSVLKGGKYSTPYGTSPVCPAASS